MTPNTPNSIEAKSLTADTDRLPTNFVTFYSFKGGVGRSMALINVASIMAGRGFRVLILDMDLEAPGISFLLPAALGKPKGTPIPGFVDLMLQVLEDPDKSDLFARPAATAIDNYIYPYPIPEKLCKSTEGSLHIMPAGITDSDYQQRLEDLDLPGLYHEGRGQKLMLVYKQIIADSRRFDFVFIDSRTGFSDEAGICTRDLADRVVVLSGLNNQNIQGTANFLRALHAATEGKKPVSIVLSPVPISEDDLRDQRIELAQQEFSSAYGHDFDISLQIPYHPRLALTEEPYIFRSSQGYLHDAYYKVEEMVRTGLGLIPKKLVWEARLALEARNYALLLLKLRHTLRIANDSQWLASVVSQLQQKPLTDDSKQQEARAVYEFLVQELDKNLLRFLVFSIEKRFSDLADQAWHRLTEGENPTTDDLGNYAIFLTDIRNDHDSAEAIYKRLLAADPNHAITLGNYANFLTGIRNDHDSAEALHKRALVADPNHAAILCNYALFLTNIRKNHDSAEALYKRALVADPNFAIGLSNYALFLTDIRKDHDSAEALHKRALVGDPNHANNFASYALFLTNIREDHDSAEAFFKRALDTDPNHANNLGNYAMFLFAQGKYSEGRVFLNRAFSTRKPSSALLAELHFYSYAHLWEESPNALHSLKAILHSGARSHDWNLDRNVAQSKSQGHPHPDLVAALAAVISDKAPIESLDAFPVWQSTQALPPADPAKPAS